MKPINSERLSPVIRILNPKREWLLLALMLELLHFSIWQDFGNPLSRALMLIHFGLFLIWQPIWRGDEKITVVDGVLFIVLTLGFVTWINLWLLSAWIILLTGICGGRVIINRQERNSYMIILIFLVTELLMVCVPELFNIEIRRNFSNLLSIMLPLLVYHAIRITGTIPANRGFPARSNYSPAGQPVDCRQPVEYVPQRHGLHHGTYRIPDHHRRTVVPDWLDTFPQIRFQRFFAVVVTFRIEYRHAI